SHAHHPNGQHREPGVPGHGHCTQCHVGGPTSGPPMAVKKNKKILACTYLYLPGM
ncbi:hypothetical protein NDU88_009289, partial [Pleurodeles waltl]